MNELVQKVAHQCRGIQHEIELVPHKSGNAFVLNRIPELKLDDNGMDTFIGHMARVIKPAVDRRMDGRRVIEVVYHQGEMDIFTLLAYSNSMAYYKLPQWRGRYNRLIPLIPYTAKLYYDVPYSAWDYLNKVIPLGLLDSITYGVPSIFRDVEVLRQIREYVLTHDAAGNVLRQPKNSLTAKNIDNSNIYPKEYKALPQLTKYMLLQLWCAHPSLRKPHYVLDPVTLDEMPEPLITDTVLQMLIQ